MKIALAQMKVSPGRPDINFTRMCEYIDEARAKKCAIIAFPEMCVGGYLLGDRWLDPGFCRELMSYNARLAKLSAGIALLYGNVYVDENACNRDGRSRKFNAVYAFRDGRPLERARDTALPDGVAPKTLFPNYRIFDDSRYFHSLADLAFERGVDVESLLVPFRMKSEEGDFVFGCEVCEDLWYTDYSYRGRSLNVSRILMENGAKAIFNLSSSPWTWGKDASRDRRIRDVKKDAGALVPFYYVNCVGVQNNGKNFVTFDGDSAVYDCRGEVAAELVTPYEPSLLVFDTGATSSAGRAGAAAGRAQSKAAAQYCAALEGIRALDEISGSTQFPFVVGLSGGVDSALVAALIERALGRDRLLLFNLPSRYNSDATKNAARTVAASLGCELREIGIESLVEANAALLAPFNPTQFNLENVQAKIRGTSILSNIAAITGGMMSCNGNKVEIALGYATLYGDVNGAIAPIGDLLKTEVFEMCAYLNEHVFGQELIPSQLLPDENFNFILPPTAELKSAQRDPMKWGYHDALVREFTSYRRKSPEDILEWYLEDELASRLEISPRILSVYGLDDAVIFVEDLEWLVQSMQRAVFKRVQSPPVIIMSRGAFGYDVRESQLPLYYTGRYRELRERIVRGER